MGRWKSRGGKSQRREGKRREEKRSEAKRRGEESRREEKKKDDQRRERVRRKSQKKESEERVTEERVTEERVRRKSQKKEDAGARKGRKVAIHCVFLMICGSRGSKSKLAKAAGAEPSGQMKVVVARRCGTKHMSKSKRTKHTILGALLEVEMMKKCRCKAHFEVKSVKN